MKQKRKDKYERDERFAGQNGQDARACCSCLILLGLLQRYCKFPSTFLRDLDIGSLLQQECQELNHHNKSANFMPKSLYALSTNRTRRNAICDAQPSMQGHSMLNVASAHQLFDAIFELVCNILCCSSFCLRREKGCLDLFKPHSKLKFLHHYFLLCPALQSEIRNSNRIKN